MLKSNITLDFEKKINLAAEISKLSAKYFEKIKDIILGINPAHHSQWISDSTKIASLIAELKELTRSEFNSLESLLNLFCSFDDLDSLIAAVTLIFDNESYSKLALYNVSTTDLVNIQKEAESVRKKLAEYKTCALDPIFDKIDIDPADAFKFIQDQKKVTAFTIKLISLVIPKLKGANRARLESIIEDQKDAILGATRVAADCNTSLVRYNLITFAESRPLEELFAETLKLKYNPKVSREINFKKITETNTRPGVIVLYNICRSPLEFSLKGLIDADYIIKNGLPNKTSNGLTNKILQKYTTIRDLGIIKENPEISHVLKFPGEIDSWIIFETLNGTLFRILSNSGTLLSEGNKIKGLVRGISNRPEKYNNICEEKILAQCFDQNYAMLIDDFTALTQESSENLKDEIFAQLEVSFKKNLGAVKVADAASINKALPSQKKIVAIFSSVFQQRTGTKGRGKSEYILSHIVKLETLLYYFAKEFDKKWSTVVFAPRFFAENVPAEIERSIIQIYQSILRAVSDNLNSLKMWEIYPLTLKEYYLERSQLIIN